VKTYFFMHLSFGVRPCFADRFRFTATAPRFDLTSQAMDFGLSALMPLFQEPQSVTNVLTSGRVAIASHLIPDEVLEVVSERLHSAW
jgi:hypothetical protein